MIYLIYKICLSELPLNQKHGDIKKEWVTDDTVVSIG